MAAASSAAPAMMVYERRVRSRNGANQEEERDWAGLEPLEHVAERLNAVDYLALAGTCKRWRSLAKPLARKLLASQPPSLLLFHPENQKIAVFCLSDGSCASYRCQRSYYNCVGYSQGYLLMLSGLGRTTNICTCEYYNDDEEEEEGEGEEGEEGEEEEEEEPKETDVFLYQPFTRREIGCFPISKHDIFRAIISAPPSSPECVIVAVSLYGGILLYCRPGDAEWKEFVCPEEIGIDQLVIARGKVYSLCKETGQVMAFSNIFEANLAPTAEKLPAAAVPGAPQGCALLTSAEGDLYLVCLAVLAEDDSYNHFSHDEYGETPTKAFRYDELSKDWVAVQSFGGPSAFLTRYGSILADIEGSEEWENSLCCCYPGLEYYYLDVIGRDDIGLIEHWEIFLKKEGFEVEEGSSWMPNSYWVHPSLCYHE